MSMDFPGFFFSLIIKINYPHLSQGPKSPLNPPQELEVGGRRPPYLLVFFYVTPIRFWYFGGLFVFLTGWTLYWPLLLLDSTDSY